MQLQEEVIMVQVQQLEIILQPELTKELIKERLLIEQSLTERREVKIEELTLSLASLLDLSTIQADLPQEVILVTIKETDLPQEVTQATEATILLSLTIDLLEVILDTKVQDLAAEREVALLKEMEHSTYLKLLNLLAQDHHLQAEAEEVTNTQI